MKVNHLTTYLEDCGIVSVSVTVHVPASNVTDAVASVLALFAGTAQPQPEVQMTMAQAVMQRDKNVLREMTDEPKAEQVTPSRTRTRNRRDVELSHTPKTVVEVVDINPTPTPDSAPAVSEEPAPTGVRRRRAVAAETPAADPVITDADLAKAASQAGSTPGVGPDLVMLVIQDFCKDLDLPQPPVINDIPQTKRKQFLFEIQQEIEMAIEEAKAKA